VVTALRLRADPRLLEQLHQLGAGHPLPLPQRALDQPPALRDQPVVNLELLLSALVAGEHAGSGQPDHPARVFRGHRMQRAAQCPGEHDAPVGDGPLDIDEGRAFRAQADRPCRLRVVLRLQGAEPPHNFGGRLRFQAADEQIPHSAGGDGGMEHGIHS